MTDRVTTVYFLRFTEFSLRYNITLLEEMAVGAMPSLVIYKLHVFWAKLFNSVIKNQVFVTTYQMVIWRLAFY